MSISFSKTEKGKPVLIENNFDYIEERTHENKVYWRCTQSNKQKCKARLHTISNTICLRVADHNHAPNPIISGIRQYRAEIGKLSKTTMVAQSIVATSIAMASTAVLSHLPPINNLKRTRLSTTCWQSKISSKSSITAGNTYDWFICSYEEKRTVSTNTIQQAKNRIDS